MSVKTKMPYIITERIVFGRSVWSVWRDGGHCVGYKETQEEAQQLIYSRVHGEGREAHLRLRLKDIEPGTIDERCEYLIQHGLGIHYLNGFVESLKEWDGDLSPPMRKMLNGYYQKAIQRSGVFYE